ncbi:hypothetical protein VTI28DRAFT_8511 [Corynascus sepedonium]
MVDADSKDNDGWTSLFYASWNGHEGVVKMLLDTGMVDADSKDNGGQTPLFCAAENGHEAVVKMLLDTGKVDVDSKDRDGQTPLLRAAENGHEEVVKMLPQQQVARSYDSQGGHGISEAEAHLVGEQCLAIQCWNLFVMIQNTTHR